MSSDLESLNCPLVSIITVVYNDVKGIEATILSVINQSYKKIEYIIIDGGSLDGTVEIINNYKKQVNFFLSEPDNGIYNAMNKGIKLASGEWLNFMNSGDRFYSSDTIEKVFQGFNYKNAEVIYGNTEKRFNDKRIIFKPSISRQFWRKLVVHQSIFCRDYLQKRYPFDESFIVSADFDFIFKLFFFNHKLLYINQTVCSFDMVGFSHENRYQGFSENRMIAFKYPGNFLLKWQLYLHYVKVSILGRFLDFYKSVSPKSYLKIKQIKDYIFSK